jgi:hypothetical protein
MAPAAPSMNNHQPNPEAPPDRVYLLGRLKEGAHPCLITELRPTTLQRKARGTGMPQTARVGRMEGWKIGNPRVSMVDPPNLPQFGGDAPKESAEQKQFCFRRVGRCMVWV